MSVEYLSQLIETVKSDNILLSIMIESDGAEISRDKNRISDNILEKSNRDRILEICNNIVYRLKQFSYLISDLINKTIDKYNTYLSTINNSKEFADYYQQDQAFSHKDFNSDAILNNIEYNIPTMEDIKKYSRDIDNSIPMTMDDVYDTMYKVDHGIYATKTKELYTVHTINADSDVHIKQSDANTIYNYFVAIKNGLELKKFAICMKIDSLASTFTDIGTKIDIDNFELLKWVNINHIIDAAILHKTTDISEALVYLNNLADFIFTPAITNKLNSIAKPEETPSKEDENNVT